MGFLTPQDWLHSLNAIGGGLRNVAHAAKKPLDMYDNIAGAGQRAVAGAISGRGIVPSVMHQDQSQDTTHAAEARLGLPHSGKGLGSAIEDFGFQTVTDPVTYVPGLDLFSVGGRLAKASKLGERLEHVPIIDRFLGETVEGHHLRKAVTRSGENIVKGHESAGRNARNRMEQHYQDVVTRHADELNQGIIHPEVRHALQQRAFREGTASVRKRVMKDGYVPTPEEAASRPLGMLTSYKGAEYVPKQKLKPAAELIHTKLGPYERIQQTAKKPGFNLRQGAGNESSPLSERVADRLSKGTRLENYYTTRENIMRDLGLAPAASRPAEALDRMLAARTMGRDKEASRYEKLLGKQHDAIKSAEGVRANTFKPNAPNLQGTNIPQAIHDRLFGDIIKPNASPLRDISDASRDALFGATSLPHKKNISVMQMMGPAGLKGLVRGMRYARKIKKEHANPTQIDFPKTIDHAASQPAAKPAVPDLFRYQSTPGAAEHSAERGGTYYALDKPNDRYGPKGPLIKDSLGGANLVKGVNTAKNPLDLRLPKELNDIPYGQLTAEQRKTIDAYFSGTGVGAILPAAGVAERLRPGKPTADNWLKIWQDEGGSKNAARYLKALGVDPSHIAAITAREGSWSATDRMAAELAKKHGHDAIVHGSYMPGDPDEFFALHPEAHKPITPAEGTKDRTTQSEAIPSPPSAKKSIADRIRDLENIGGTEHFIRDTEPVYEKFGPLGKFVAKRAHVVNKSLDRFETGQRLALQDELARRGKTGFDAGGEIRDILGDYKNQAPIVDELRNRLGAPFPAWHLGVVPRAAGRAIMKEPRRVRALVRSQNDFNSDVMEPQFNADFHLGGPLNEGLDLYSSPFGAKHYLSSESVTGPIGEAGRDIDALSKGKVGSVASDLARSYIPGAAQVEDLTNLSPYKGVLPAAATTAAGMMGSYFTKAESGKAKLRDKMLSNGVPKKTIDMLMRSLSTK